MLKCLFICLFLLSSNIKAEVFSHIFTPQVTIFGSTSDSVEIQSEESSFVIPYSIKKKSFANLAIPFRVVSLNSTNINYKISLAFQQHFCTHNNKEIPLTNVAIELDNEPLLPEGHTHNAVEKNHTMTLIFPEILPQYTLQQCQGTVGIQVEGMI
jgi:hypothetical protein